MRSIWKMTFGASVTIVLLATISLCAEERRGFVVNWTSRPVFVSIKGMNRSVNLNLPPVDSMGKGDYLFHRPNVALLLLEDGSYTANYGYSENGFQEIVLRVYKHMILPFELDIEERQDNVKSMPIRSR